MKKCAMAGLAAMALLAACGGGGEPGGVTAEESSQLNEAANMLDSAPDTVVASDETGLANSAATAETGDLMVADNAATNGQ